MVLGVHLWILNKFEVTFGVFRDVGIFLIASTVFLFLLAFRRSRIVVLDGANFVLVRGTKQTTIPWNAFADEKSKLKLEDVIAWQRLNIKAFSYGQKTTLSLDRIFGAGLPVREIAAMMLERIETACGRELSLD